MRNVGGAQRQPGREAGAVHPLDARLEGSAPDHRHLPGVGGPVGSGLDAADDVHEGQGRERAANGARTGAGSSSVPAGTGTGPTATEPALPDAARWGRGPEAHGRQGRHRRAPGSPRTGVARLRRGEGGGPPALGPPSGGDRHGEAPKPADEARHAGPVVAPSPDSRRIYFTAPDTVDKDNRTRVEKKFTVNIRNEAQPVGPPLGARSGGPQGNPAHVGDRLHGSGVTMLATTAGGWASRAPDDRYQRNVTESDIYGDVYLLEAATGRISGSPTNAEIGESTALVFA